MTVYGNKEDIHMHSISVRADQVLYSFISSAAINRGTKQSAGFLCDETRHGPYFPGTSNQVGEKSK